MYAVNQCSDPRDFVSPRYKAVKVSVLSSKSIFSFAALGPYCQDLEPIFSQYGPRAWLIRYISLPHNWSITHLHR